MFVRNRSLGRPGIVAFLAGILWCCLAGMALAHASLTAAVPPDGAVVAAPPKTLSLSFSEPVSPLVLKLILPDGQARALDGFVLRDTTLEITAPDGLGPGTHVLTWRVVSEDGHPVAGSTLFSIGAPGSAPQAAAEAIDWPVRSALWLAKVVTYAGLCFGIGGVFAARWLISGVGGGSRLVGAATWTGLGTTVLSLGLQGLDALGAPLAGFFDAAVWKAGFATSFGPTVAVLTLAFCLAVVAGRSGSAVLNRTTSLAALVAGCVALALSGHASAAAPQWLTRPAVLVHALTIAIWVGALLPLASALRCDKDAGRRALDRFSRLIPLCVALLILAGLLLAVIQVREPAALLSTAYGNVLLAKTGLLAVLFGLVAVNRWMLTGPAARGERKAVRRLFRAVVVETLIVVAIFAVAATWRFTPPPRALAVAAAQPATVHIHSDKAMVEVTVAPGRAGPVEISAVLLGADFKPLNAKEVTFVLSNAQAGVEPMRRKAQLQTDGTWKARDVVIPLAGQWQVRIDVLVGDFELLRLHEAIEVQP
ncbi:copper resistance protein CopC [Rhizobium sp. TRM96647]|uniref:copper resistance CopC/CopD family protein n=1 Tax=unclassified Rhizobium TaxID=2613769 RepID=UPI0021E8E300|nr:MULTISPECIES: copper resistance protein CopC [unclassified Rhizobium]MCV3739177.1 copper resistance protein CopC [Rhizobium sp. TRM96647]MCV3760818.1 copper resistance protein CopC [Rhizobium sp. TRM96650]